MIPGGPVRVHAYPQAPLPVPVIEGREVRLGMFMDQDGSPELGLYESIRDVGECSV